MLLMFFINNWIMFLIFCLLYVLLFILLLIVCLFVLNGNWKSVLVNEGFFVFKLYLNILLNGLNWFFILWIKILFFVVVRFIFNFGLFFLIVFLMYFVCGLNIIIFELVMKLGILVKLYME